MKRILLYLSLIVTTLLVSSPALASHFRYGTITWRIPDITKPKTVEFTVTAAWRADSVDSTQLNFGDGTANPSTTGVSIGTGLDALGKPYDVRQYKVTKTYAGFGPYIAFYATCCRISGLQNGSGGDFRVETEVNLQGGNLAGPATSSPAIIQLQVGNVRSYTFPAFDSDGDPVTCRFATAAESDLPAGSEVPSVPNGGAKPTITTVPNGCKLDWDLTKAVVGQQYVVHIILESVHGGFKSKAPLDLIVEMVTPPPPTCAGTGVYVANVGQQLTVPVIGTNSVVGNLKMTAVGLPSGATLTPGSGTSAASPFTTTLNWTAQQAQAGSTNLVQVNFTNAQNLTGTCFLTIQVPTCPNFGQPCSAGVGECKTTGILACQGAQTVCSAVAGTPKAEVCDGKDNDCNGQIDDGNPEAGQACATALKGVCATGKTSCSGGALACVPNVQPGTQTESCDGLDNDCNGQTDEGLGLGDACTSGVGACKASGVKKCGAGGAVVCSATPGTPAAEKCDGIDNDCDGTVDNGNPGSGASCGTGLSGVCAAGKTTCGVGGSIECVPDVAPGSTAEICDGLDNDCDGLTDEGFNVGAACTNGVGECVTMGVVVCDAGAAKCNAVPKPPQPEVCDGKDNNCDGTVDDNQPGAGAPCNSGLPGVCASGSTACKAGGIACVPNTQPGTLVETCDGKDNDCDGVTDEGFNVGDACAVGLGECKVTGKIVCNGNGAATCDAVPGKASDELCDGKDNNCDGVVDDNNPESNADCDSGLPGVCKPGKTNCADGGKLECVPGVKPGTQKDDCDGLDNDCNGTTDDGFNVGSACSVGVGACQNSGQVVCDAEGGATCTATAGEPKPEICADGIDSDCDGVDNNGCECLEDASCGDPKSGTICDNVLGGSFKCLPGCRAVDGNGCPDGLLCTSKDKTVGKCVECITDADCGDASSGKVCDGTTSKCIDGCRGQDGNGCPSPKVCDSATAVIGTCVDCNVDADCGDASSGKVCDTTQKLCIDGCRGVDGNGCPAPQVCTSTTDTVGACVQCTGDAQCGDAQSGKICDTTKNTCIDGCRGQDGNGCPAMFSCTSTTSDPGTCVGCLKDSDCGDATSGKVCEANECVAGCRGMGGNGCPSPLNCSSADGTKGACVGCTTDGQCGGPTSGIVCVEQTCKAGCRGQGGNGCELPLVCSSTNGDVGTCVGCVTDTDCGGPMSGKVCKADTQTCVDGCRGMGGNGCPGQQLCSSKDATIGVCSNCFTDADCGGEKSGKVCDDKTKSCVDGCRGSGGNGCADTLACSSTDATIGVCLGCVSDKNCPDGQICDATKKECTAGCNANKGCPAPLTCSSTDATPGQCVGCNSDADCGTANSGKVCDNATKACVEGCRGKGGNGCSAGKVCTSKTEDVGTCVGCATDADCGDAQSGKICDTKTNACTMGCRGKGGNGCPAAQTCTSKDETAGVCVGCTTDADCGDAKSGKICDAKAMTCVTGCRGKGGNGCPTGSTCTSTDEKAGMCVGCTTDADCGDPKSGKICDPTSKTCKAGCKGTGGNGCPEGQTCSTKDASIGVCMASGCKTDAECGAGSICGTDGTCKPGCKTDGECGAGSICGADGRCKSGCKSDSECGAGSICGADKQCKSGCNPSSSTNTCPTGNVCVADGTGGKCVAAEVTLEGGCACTTPGSNGSSPATTGAPLVFLAALGLLARRRASKKAA